VGEYYKMAKAGILHPDERVELIEGEIIRMPPIGITHASRVNRVTYHFLSRAGEAAQVIIQNPLRLSDHSEPVPDAMLVRPRTDFYAERHPTPADVFLVVEVSDATLSYDQRTKLPLYARHGVPEVWIVDVNHELIQVHREPASDGYHVTTVARRGEQICPAAVPSLQLAVEDILG
jgi:Uma2 family endonuclease